MTTIRIGIVGLGRLGFIHASNIAFSLKKATLSAVCSLSQDELNHAARELFLPESSCYSDFKTMLASGKIDAVIIASSSAHHCDQVVLALEAGLHVFCEKPMGTTVKECHTIEGAVNKYKDRIFMLGYMRRYDASYRYAKEKIEAGDIGKPVLFRGYSVDPSHAMEGFLNFLPNSGGQFLDMAVHDIDMARWLLKSEPRTIYAMGGSFAFPQFADHRDGDNVAALMQFENDAMVFLLAGRTASHGYNVETEIIGTRATLRIGSVPQKNLVEILDSSGVRQECTQCFSERFEHAFIAELQEFVDCILEQRKPEITAYDGTRATEIAVLATESFRENKLIHLTEAVPIDSDGMIVES